MNEQDYLRGEQAAANGILKAVMRYLPDDKGHLVLTAERVDTILKLREICETYGDNDWPDGLHLADILDKHLLRHLERDKT